VNRAYGARSLGPLPRGDVYQDCVERRRQFEAAQTDVTIITPGRPDDRWRAILPLGVLPDDGTTIGARSLCDPCGTGCSAPTGPMRSGARWTLAACTTSGSPSPR